MDCIDSDVCDRACDPQRYSFSPPFGHLAGSVVSSTRDNGCPGLISLYGADSVEVV